MHWLRPLYDVVKRLDFFLVEKTNKKRVSHRHNFHFSLNLSDTSGTNQFFAPDISAIIQVYICCRDFPLVLFLMFFLNMCLLNSQDTLYSLTYPNFDPPFTPRTVNLLASSRSQLAFLAVFTHCLGCSCQAVQAVLSFSVPQLPGMFFLCLTFPTYFQSNFSNVQTTSVTRHSQESSRQSIK